MNSKKIGIVIFVFGIIIALIVINFISQLNNNAKDIGCFKGDNCAQIGYKLDMAHFAFGIIGFILAMGVYLFFFSKSEEAILKRLEETKKEQTDEEKFNLILRGLDQFEKKVLLAIKEQDGITQNTLRIRTNLSKAKLSYVLKSLEEKELIKRVQKGKTLAVYLRV